MQMYLETRLRLVCTIQALKMVLEKESWLKMSTDAMQMINLAGLVGYGAPLIVPSDRNNAKIQVLHSKKSPDPIGTGNQRNGFGHWLKTGNLFMLKLTYGSNECPSSSPLLNGATISGATEEKPVEILHNDKFFPINNDVNHMNGNNFVSENESEDLLADFIDEDSQLPSRISKPMISRNLSSHWNDEEIAAQTGSSLCLLR